MARAKKLAASQESEHDLSFFSEDYMAEEGAMLDMMSGFVEASSKQLEHTIDLTKLVVENVNRDTLNAEEIFSIFKRASQVVSENSPLKEILEKA